MTASLVKKHVAGSYDAVENISTPVENDTGSRESNSLNNSMVLSDEYARLSRGLQKWAERHDQVDDTPLKRRDSTSSNVSPEVSLHDLCDALTVNDDAKAIKKKP